MNDNRQNDLLRYYESGADKHEDRRATMINQLNKLKARAANCGLNTVKNEIDEKIAELNANKKAKAKVLRGVETKIKKWTQEILSQETLLYGHRGTQHTR